MSLKTKKPRLRNDLLNQVQKDDTRKTVFARVSAAEYWKLKRFLSRNQIKMEKWIKNRIKEIDENA
jgi:hypothetical protein